MEDSCFRGTLKLDGRKINWRSLFGKETTYDCLKCGMCCYYQVGLTDEEAHGLRGKKKTSKSFKSCETTTVQGQKTACYCMNSKDDGSCTHLTKDHLCDIYRMRPHVCRVFPFALTPDVEGGAVVDIDFRCPYVNVEGLPKVKKKDVENAVNDSVKSKDMESFKAVSEYRTTLAKHLRTTFRVSFLPAKERDDFMKKALDILFDTKFLTDMPLRVHNWYDEITTHSYDVLINQDKGTLSGEKRSERILKSLKKQMSKVGDPGKANIDKNRWGQLLSDLKNIICVRDDKIYRVPVHIGWIINVGGVGTRGLDKLQYSKEAISYLKKYFLHNTRRPQFQVTCLLASEYLLDVKEHVAVDYTMDAVLLSNILSQYIDFAARVAAAFRSHDRIEREDVLTATDNVDPFFTASLNNGLLLREMKSQIDKNLG